MKKILLLCLVLGSCKIIEEINKKLQIINYELRDFSSITVFYQL